MTVPLLRIPIEDGSLYLPNTGEGNLYAAWAPPGAPTSWWRKKSPQIVAFRANLDTGELPLPAVLMLGRSQDHAHTGRKIKAYYRVLAVINYPNTDGQPGRNLDLLATQIEGPFAGGRQRYLVGIGAWSPGLAYAPRIANHRAIALESAVEDNAAADAQALVDPFGFEVVSIQRKSEDGYVALDLEAFHAARMEARRLGSAESPEVSSGNPNESPEASVNEGPTWTWDLRDLRAVLHSNRAPFYSMDSIGGRHPHAAFRIQEGSAELALALAMETEEDGRRRVFIRYDISGAPAGPAVVVDSRLPLDDVERLVWASIAAWMYGDGVLAVGPIEGGYAERVEAVLAADAASVDSARRLLAREKDRDAVLAAARNALRVLRNGTPADAAALVVAIQALPGADVAVEAMKIESEVEASAPEPGATPPAP